MLPSSTNEDLKERLDAMPMEDFEVLLKQACQPSPTNQQPDPEHAEILKQLKGTLDGHGDNSNLSNAKYHSSLQSLNNNEGTRHPTPQHQNNHHIPTTQEPNTKGHHYGHHQYGHLNHTSTLTTINSTSSLNSVGVDGESPHQKQPQLAYFFNDRDNDRAPAAGTQRGFKTRGSMPIQRSDEGTEMTSTITWENACGLTADHPYDPIAPEATYYSGATGATSLSPEASRSLTPMSFNTNTNKDGAGDRRRLAERSAKKKSSKTNVKEVNIEVKKIPGYRGNEEDVDDLVHFVLGDDAPSNKKKNKKDQGAKTKETLVKSASLDENHLNTRKRSSSSSTERSTSKSLKEVEKKSERAVSSYQISLDPSQQPDYSQPPPGAVTAQSKKLGVGQQKPNKIKDESGSQKKESIQQKPVKEDDSMEHPFELVTKKKKTKKTTTQREAEAFSRRQAKEASRREQVRARRAGGGERRTSVCSAPESENSDQSDDDSVRSLPAGECTPRERIPKQCASSGGTPQTSYADIAKAPESSNKMLSPLPSPSTIHGDESDHSTQSNKTLPIPQTLKKGCDASKDIPIAELKDCQNEREVSKTGVVPNSIKCVKPNAHPPTAPGAKLLPVVSRNAVNMVPGQTNQNHRSNLPTRTRNQYQNQKNQLILQTMPQPERPYLSTVIKTTHSSSQNENTHPAKGKEEVKVLIEDTTEFPDICSSMSSLSTKPPFSKKTAHNNHNGQNSIFITNVNNNNNNNADNGSTIKIVTKSESLPLDSKMEPTIVSANSPSQVKEKSMRNSDETVLSIITTEKSPIVEGVVCVVQPVFIPDVPKQTVAAIRSSPPVQEEVETVPLADEAALVNGDHDQGDVDVEDIHEGRSRNSTSVSSSVGGGEAVVFCRGNVESEIPNQDVGFEFGFNVMEHTTYLPWSQQSQMLTETDHPVVEDTAVALDESYKTPPNKPLLRDPEVNEGVDIDELAATTTRWGSPDAEQQEQQYDKQHQSARYSSHSRSGGPPPSLLGSYRGPIEGGNVRPPRGSYSGRRGQQGGYNNRGGRNNVSGTERNTQQAGAPIQVQHQQPQYNMPIPLPPLPAGPPPQIQHYGTNAPQIPPHMLPHYGMMAGAHHQGQAQQSGYQPPPRVHIPQHYLPQPPMVGMNIYAYPPQQHTIPVTSAPGMMDDPSIHHMQPQQQAHHPLAMTIPPGANTNMTMATQPFHPMPMMMPPPQGYVPIQQAQPIHPSTNPGAPFIGEINYNEGGAVMVPPGVANPYLYYPPPNYPVPNASGQVASWMNDYFEQKVQLGADGQLSIHRID